MKRKQVVGNYLPENEEQYQHTEDTPCNDKYLYARILVIEVMDRAYGNDAEPAFADENEKDHAMGDDRRYHK